ncbi:MAG: DMT family transporter [Clostridia bacterium]|nr:DMT family transporter [Clostridia bacterium]
MWFIFALITTLAWGLAELFYKKGARQDEKYSHLKICVAVGIVMGIHAIFTLLTQDIGYNPVNLVRYLPVSLLYILSMTFSFFGMRFIEESISDPIENTSGAMCSLLCVIFLKETLSIPAIIAIIVMAIGVLGVGFLENKGETIRKKVLGKKMAVIAFCMPFVYAILDAVGSFADVFYLDDVANTPLIGVTEKTLEDVANTSYELTFALFALVLFIFMKIKKVNFGSLPKQKDKFLSAIFETAGQFTYVYAMSGGNGAKSAPIISSVCVVSLLLSRIFLKEKLSAKKYLFISIVIVGILMLAIEEELGIMNILGF